MRISDWSSDVCSSDLALRVGQRRRLRPVADRGDDLGVVVALGVAEVAFVAYVLHAEQAKRRRGGIDLAVGVGELAVEDLAPVRLRAGLLQRSQHPRQVLAQRQPGQRPARSSEEQTSELQ